MASAARRPGAYRRPETSAIEAASPRPGTVRGAKPAEPDGGTPGRYINIGTLQLRHPTAPNTSHPDLFAYPMTTAARANTTSWTFRTRFRRGAFGWKGTQLAIGRINGATVQFLVDTGATEVSVPAGVARGLGLAKGLAQSVQTANGVIATYSTRLDRVELGTIQLRDVRAHINPHMRSDEVLLGMSFLRNLELVQRGRSLTLRQFPFGS